MKRKINKIFFIAPILFYIIGFTINDKLSDKVTLRKFPYPYKAAIAINSDIDETATVKEFLEIQKFLNTTLETPIGKGVGLEIGNSFWMYSVDPRDEFIYFNGPNFEPSESASVIIDFIKAGYIDTIHGFGNFSKAGGFTREMALKMTEELNKQGCQVRIFTNHGDTFNKQNIGTPAFYLGDNPDSVEYHVDVVTHYGIKFFWKSDLTHIVGQDRTLDISESVDNKKFVLQTLKSFVGKYTIWSSNKLIDVVTLDDGIKAYSFKRYGFWEKAKAEDLFFLINVSTLEKLKSKNGYMVVYTHLGKNSDAEYFIPTETQQALRYLANEYKKGEIYVTTTSKLLRYNLIHNRLDWSVNREGGYFNIVINKVLDEISGKYIPKVGELEGVTFYTPCAEKTRLFIGGDQVYSFFKNPPDRTGRESVSFPLQFLKFPEKYLSN